MTKADIEKKKNLGRSLYLSGMELTEIAEQLGVSRQSVSKWCTAEGWKESRAAKNISRPELVNKLLLAIDNLIGQVNASGDPEAIGSLADKLSKLSSTIEKLDKKANVIDAIEVFMAFNRWIQDRRLTTLKSRPSSSRPSTSTRTSSSWKKWLHHHPSDSIPHLVLFDQIEEQKPKKQP